MKTKKENRAEIARNLANKGYKPNKKNIFLLLDIMNKAEQERGAVAERVYLPDNIGGNVCVCFAGCGSSFNYYQGAELETENDPAQFLINTLKADKERYYRAVDVWGFTVGEIKSNKPQALQTFADEQAAAGFRVDFVAFSAGSWYRFRSFTMRNKTAHGSAVDGLAINNAYNIKSAQQTRKYAERLFFILSREDYFQEIEEKQKNRRANRNYIRYNFAADFTTDRLTAQQVDHNCTYYGTGAPTFQKTARGLDGYKFGINENPLDKSGYFLPYFRAQLFRRLDAYKRELNKKRYDAADKSATVTELLQIKNELRAACLSLFAAFDDIYFKNSFDEGIKYLSGLMCDCDDITNGLKDFRNLEELAAKVDNIKAKKEKYIFFYNVERIKKYKYACMHHYEKKGDHYETAEKYKADTFWGDPANYSQVIY